MPAVTPIVISSAVEGVVDEAVIKRLIVEAGGNISARQHCGFTGTHTPLATGAAAGNQRGLRSEAILQ